MTGCFFDNFLLNTATFMAFNAKKLTKNAQIFEIKCIASNYDIITAWNHDVITQTDEKHLNESCSKISEQYHDSKKRYCKFSPKMCQAMEIAKQWSLDLRHFMKAVYAALTNSVFDISS